MRPSAGSWPRRRCSTSCARGPRAPCPPSSLPGMQVLRALHVVLDPPAEERVADDVAVGLAEAAVAAQRLDERLVVVAERHLDGLLDDRIDGPLGRVGVVALE